MILVKWLWGLTASSDDPTALSCFGRMAAWACYCVGISLLLPYAGPAIPFVAFGGLLIGAFIAVWMLREIIAYQDNHRRRPPHELTEKAKRQKMARNTA